MSETVLPKSGLVKPALKQADWHEKLNDGFQAFEDRLGLSRAGDPNGAIEGHWFGQPCYDTAGGVMYECVRPGPATGTNRALWLRKTSVEPGTIEMFYRASLPLGYIGFGATYQKSLYPLLAPVLPTGITQTSTTFTLPTIADRGLLFRHVVSSGSIGLVDDTANATLGPTLGADCMLVNVLMGVKF